MINVFGCCFQVQVFKTRNGIVCDNGRQVYYMQQVNKHDVKAKHGKHRQVQIEMVQLQPAILVWPCINLP